MSTSEPAVICRDVVKTYGKGEIAVRALKGVSLEARFGELLMIVGPSGCGNTTLLSVMCGTLRADSGTIELFGKSISSMPERELTAFRKGTRENPIPLTFVRVEPYILPKKSLTGESTERVDTRVLQVIYTFDMPKTPVYVGQQMDVFIDGTTAE
jgi:ABC-type multidrug transport system ATPase subunit